MSELDHPPLTHAVRKALQDVNDPVERDDLLFLERWELCAEPGVAAARRAAQLRRANPRHAAAIRTESLG